MFHEATGGLIATAGMIIVETVQGAVLTRVVEMGGRDLHSDGSGVVDGGAIVGGEGRAREVACARCRVDFQSSKRCVDIRTTVHRTCRRTALVVVRGGEGLYIEGVRFFFYSFFFLAFTWEAFLFLAS